MDLGLHRPPVKSKVYHGPWITQTTCQKQGLSLALDYTNQLPKTRSLMALDCSNQPAKSLVISLVYHRPLITGITLTGPPQKSLKQARMLMAQNT